MVEQHEKVLVPEIRFAGFTDPWEQRKLGEVASKRIEKNTNGIEETFTNSAEHGIVSQLDYFDHDITNDANIGNYSVVYPDDFVYNPRISTIAPCGPINRNKLGRNGVMSPLYTVFSVDDMINKLYLEHYFKTNRWHQFMFLEGNSGARSDRFSISDSTFFEMPIQCPVLEEQELIALFFDRLDSLITLHQRKLELLRNIKKSMLDKMFPKGGALYPEIRFAGFTDPWEQRKLGELCSFSKGYGYSKNNLRDQGTPIILYGRLYTNYETQIHSVDTFVDPLENSVYTEGGEVIVPASGETAEDISIASVVEKPGIILGGDLNIITPSAVVNPVFLALELSYGKPHFDLAKRAQGKSVVHIHNEDIANVFFDHPCIAEQRRIGAFFDRLDSLITLHQRKLELLRNIKKSMLDKMFV
ncbi:restriction endonuclease subunit S [Bifidobacterium catenulatum]|uniref:restriction endonuclease subunit S n=2 Tax=Bifidobacterium TaxID=1678 RepID=UPI003D327BA0